MAAPIVTFHDTPGGGGNVPGTLEVGMCLKSMSSRGKVRLSSFGSSAGVFHPLTEWAPVPDVHAMSYNVSISAIQGSFSLRNNSCCPRVAPYWFMNAAPRVDIETTTFDFEARLSLAEFFLGRRSFPNVRRHCQNPQPARRAAAL